MADPSLTGGFDLPFAEQADFFRKKLNLPTERWDDIWQSAHDRSFVVAGAMKADLLDELRQAVDKAITKGTTLETFRKEFRDITDRLGWPGKAGQGTLSGFNWRTKVIYETNLRSSYAAGRWAQLNDPGLQKLMPFWRYVHNESVLHPRPLHAKWGAMRLTLPHDHPFWQTHFPPNGWGCRCRVVAVTGPKKGDATAPPEGWDNIDAKTMAPVGIDKGWGYAPGASIKRELADMVKAKVDSLPPALGKVLAEDVASNTPKIAKTVAEAGRIAKEIIDQQPKAWPLDATGEAATRFSHPGCLSKKDIRTRKIGVASWVGLNVDTANVGNAWLLKAQAEADRLGLPRLRGVNTAPGAGASGSMGDGILSVTKSFDVTGTPPQPPKTYKLAEGKTGRPQGTSEYFATNRERFEKTMWHEFGHHVHQTLGVDGYASYVKPPLESRLATIINDAIIKAGGSNSFDFPSEYAKKNCKEYFAECYCLHKMGRGDLVPAFMNDVIAKIERGEMP